MDSKTTGDHTDDDTFKKISMFSFLFLVLYIPFNSVEILTSQIQIDNGYGSLGFVLLGIYALSQMLGSIIASSICQKIEPGKSLVIGGTGLALMVFS